MGKISQIRLFVKRQDGVSKQEMDVLEGVLSVPDNGNNKKSITRFGKKGQRTIKRQ